MKKEGGNNKIQLIIKNYDAGLIGYLIANLNFFAYSKGVDCI